MDIKDIVKGIVLIAISVSLSLVLVGGDNQPDEDDSDFGRGTRFPNGISADSTSPSGPGNVRGATLTMTGASTLTGDVTASGDVTVGGGDLNVTSTDAATSTIEVGCIEMSPTSTASLAHISFSIASTTLTTEGVTSDGLVAWSFGACPI